MSGDDVLDEGVWLDDLPKRRSPLQLTGAEHGPDGPWANRDGSALSCGCVSTQVAMSGHRDGCVWQTALADAQERAAVASVVDEDARARQRRLGVER